MQAMQQCNILQRYVDPMAEKKQRSKYGPAKEEDQISHPCSK